MSDEITYEILKFDEQTETIEFINSIELELEEGEYISSASGEFSMNSEHYYIGGSSLFAFTNFNDLENITLKKVLDNFSSRSTSFYQLGPNNKIYINNYIRKKYNDLELDRYYEYWYISEISNVNDIDNVTYEAEALKIDSTHRGGQLHYLPNIPTTYYYNLMTNIDSIEICIGESLFVQNTTVNEPYWIEYYWTAPNGEIYKTRNLEIESITKEMSGIFTLSTNLTDNKSTKKVYVRVLGPDFELEAIKTEICVGDTTTLYVEPNDIDFEYKSIIWSNGDTTKTTNIYLPGIYTVAVTGFDGCTVNKEIEIFDDKPDISINSIRQPIFCSGDSTILEVEPFDDTYEYIWSTGETGKQITVKTGGLYSVIAQNDFSCIDTAFKNIIVKDTLAVVINGRDICNDGKVTLEALPNDPSYTYEWSNGETTPTIEVSQPATYTVTVSKDGCSGTAEFTVNESQNPEFEILGEEIVCGNSATLSPNKDFAEYLWSTDEVTKEIEVTEPGTYTLTVTDENGCSSREEFTVNEQSLSFDISKDRIDFGKVYISETRVDSAEIINKSGFDITIQSGDEQYRILDGQTVQYNKTLNPTELGPYKDSFEYRVIEPCDTVITIPVTAEVFARVEISTKEETKTKIGAEVSIPVYLQAEADLGEQTYTITTDIDKTVLFTEDDYTFTQTAPINKTKTQTHEINGTIMLASELEYEITFPSYEFNNPYIEVSTDQGTIKIDSVCAFPQRSIIFTETTEMKVSPNPARDRLLVVVSTGHFDKLNDQSNKSVAEPVEASGQQMQLELISAEGRVAYSENWTQTSSEKQLSINTDKIPSGLYQVRLQTPSGVLTENVIVVR
jgi:hypothetical protein